MWPILICKIDREPLTYTGIQTNTMEVWPNLANSDEEQTPKSEQLIPLPK